MSSSASARGIASLAVVTALACGAGSAAEQTGSADELGSSSPDDGTDEHDGPVTTDPNDDSADDDGATGQDPLEDIGELEVVANGFSFTEGPVWVPELGALLFTNIPADAILRLDGSTNEVSSFLEGTGAYVNGLGLDGAGNLLMCEGARRRLTRGAIAGGDVEVLAGTWSGDPLNSPNDVARHPSGSIFFTDATYGTDPGFGGSPAVLDFQGIYRLDPRGELSLVDDRRMQPNGVVIAPDGATLYVADTPTSEVFAYPLDAAGVPGPGSVIFHVEGGGDGMSIDEDGNLYVASAAGIEIWRPDGSERWGTIATPDVPTNCAFGGDDRRVLYITLPTAVARVRLAIPGLENAS